MLMFEASWWTVSIWLFQFDIFRFCVHCPSTEIMQIFRVYQLCIAHHLTNDDTDNLEWCGSNVMRLDRPKQQEKDDKTRWNSEKKTRYENKLRFRACFKRNTPKKERRDFMDKTGKQLQHPVEEWMLRRNLDGKSYDITLNALAVSITA